MSDDTETGLPASIEEAWGVRRRPRKGPNPGLDLERIVAAAVKLAVAEGIEAVSMSRVAPYDFATSSFSAVSATAVTVAPSTAPTCTAALPTPPPAPSTMSSSPGFSSAIERSTW